MPAGPWSSTCASRHVDAASGAGGAEPPRRVSVSLERVGIRYRGGVDAVRDVSLAVAKGEFVAVLGPSGCGKSTILNAIAGLLDPEATELSGRILIDGAEARTRSRRELNRMLLQSELLRIWELTPRTILFVTHDLAEAIVLAQRVVVMSRRPGTVKAVYDIALPYPRDAFALRGASEFVELEATIWNALRDEFRAPVEGGVAPLGPPASPV